MRRVVRVALSRAPRRGFASTRSASPFDGLAAKSKRAAMFEALERAEASGANAEGAPRVHALDGVELGRRALGRLEADLRSLKESGNAHLNVDRDGTSVTLNIAAPKSPLKIFKVAQAGSHLTLTTPSAPSAKVYAVNETGQWLSVEDGHDLVCMRFRQ